MPTATAAPSPQLSSSPPGPSPTSQSSSSTNILTIYNYHFPIFLTFLHMLACAIYTFLSIHFLHLVPYQPLLSLHHLSKIFTLSTIFSFSVVFGNISLRYIPVSFNQAIGATTPFFTAIFSFLLTYKSESFSTYLSLLPVVLGIVIASNNEPLFHLFGFLIYIGSTASRALKSVLQGILLKPEAEKEKEKLHSMNLLMYMAPIAALILLPISMYVEGNVGLVTMEMVRGDWFVVVMLVGNGMVAYLVNLMKFMVTKHTSALTLQVLGNAKAVMAAVVSVLVFRNPVTGMGVVGFAVTMVGVPVYSEARKRLKGTSSSSSSSSH